MSRTCAGQNTVNLSSDTLGGQASGQMSRAEMKQAAQRGQAIPDVGEFHSLARKTLTDLIWVLVTGPFQVESWLR